MGDRYVLLNLADPGQFGAFNTMKAGITTKRTVTGAKKFFSGDNQINSHNLFQLLADDLQHQLKDSDVQQIRQECVAAKKIYLATHGTPSDTDHAFAAASGGTALCDFSNLALFMLKLLPDAGRTYNLALIMCYGGRTENYRAANLNHQGQIGPSDLRTSFAYKFFRRICIFRNVRMTARTGAVAFDGRTGDSMVEQEVAIDARVDKEEFLKDTSNSAVISAWQTEKKVRDKDRIQGPAWMTLNDKFKNKPFLPATNRLEQIVKDYQDILRTKGDFQKIQDDNPDLAKFGKIVYTYDASGLTIINKYGDSA